MRDRVAIAEQIESPAEARKARGSKALVERAIIRLVTPGTLTEETLLDSGVPTAGGNCTGWRRMGDCGSRYFDRPFRTGRLRDRRTEGGAGPAFTRRDDRRWRQFRGSRSRQERRVRQPMPAKRALKSLRVATLDGFGAPGRAELAAAGGLLAYLDATQKEAGDLPTAPRRIARNAYVDRQATRASLEILVSQW